MSCVVTFIELLFVLWFVRKHVKFVTEYVINGAPRCFYALLCFLLRPAWVSDNVFRDSFLLVGRCFQSSRCLCICHLTARQSFDQIEKWDIKQMSLRAYSVQYICFYCVVEEVWGYQLRHSAFHWAGKGSKPSWSTIVFFSLWLSGYRSL